MLHCFLMGRGSIEGSIVRGFAGAAGKVKKVTRSGRAAGIAIGGQRFLRGVQHKLYSFRALLPDSHRASLPHSLMNPELDELRA